MTVMGLLERLANEQATADAARTGGTLPYVQAATVELLDTARDRATGTTTACFVLDYVVLHSAQSGSDWYVHHVLAGTATIVGDEVQGSSLVRLREANVSEYDMEWAAADARYDHDRVRAADRDAWWSSHRAAHGHTSNRR